MSWQGDENVPEVSWESVRAMGIDLTAPNEQIVVELYRVAREKGCSCVPLIVVQREENEDVLVMIRHANRCKGLQLTRGKEGRN